MCPSQEMMQPRLVGQQAHSPSIHTASQDAQIRKIKKNLKQRTKPFEDNNMKVKNKTCGCKTSKETEDSK